MRNVNRKQLCEEDLRCDLAFEYAHASDHECPWYSFWNAVLNPVARRTEGFMASGVGGDKGQKYIGVTIHCPQHYVTKAWAYLYEPQPEDEDEDAYDNTDIAFAARSPESDELNSNFRNDSPIGSREPCTPQRHMPMWVPRLRHAPGTPPSPLASKGKNVGADTDKLQLYPAYRAQVFAIGQSGTTSQRGGSDAESHTDRTSERPSRTMESAVSPSDTSALGGSQSPSSSALRRPRVMDSRKYCALRSFCVPDSIYVRIYLNPTTLKTLRSRVELVIEHKGFGFIDNSRTDTPTAEQIRVATRAQVGRQMHHTFAADENLPIVSSIVTVGNHWVYSEYTPQDVEDFGMRPGHDDREYAPSEQGSCSPTATLSVGGLQFPPIPQALIGKTKTFDCPTERKQKELIETIVARLDQLDKLVANRYHT